MRPQRRWRLWLGLCALVFNVAAAPILDEAVDPQAGEVKSLPRPAAVPIPEAMPTPTLSTYWSPRVRQWDTLIIQEAERRGLDPDFP
ncbi:MAG TPA: hypothetical protein PLD43_12930, partial [Anaerolineae bacterium]|nr:hypothetical protein [Anaerolineae bacterium]